MASVSELPLTDAILLALRYVLFNDSRTFICHHNFDLYIFRSAAAKEISFIERYATPKDICSLNIISKEMVQRTGNICS